MLRRAGGRRVMSVPSSLQRPAVGRLEAGDHLQQRRLARAAGAQEGQQLARAMSSDTPSSATTSPKRLPEPSISEIGRRGVVTTLLSAFLSIQAFHSSSALVPFSAYQASSIQNCLSMYWRRQEGLHLGVDEVQRIEVQAGIAELVA